MKNPFKTRNSSAPQVQRFFSPAFIIVVVFLLAAMLSLEWLENTFELFLSKDPLPLRKELYLLPSELGPYEMVNQEPDLEPEIEAVLGAEAYITREYRDTRADDPRKGMIRLHIAYFTGTPDTVMHVPEVCYIGGGAQGRDFVHTELSLPERVFLQTDNDQLAATTQTGQEVSVPDRQIPVRAFNFVPKGGGDLQTVIYFFAANGKFLGTPESVRSLVFDVRDRYAYWCKIEMLPLDAHDSERAIEMVADFVSYALPEVLACLPDWQEVKSGKFPPNENEEKAEN